MMARKPKQQDKVEEVIAPDYGQAVRIYRNDIKPAQAKVGEYAQEQSTAYKAIKKSAHVDPGAARLAFRLDNMEENKRDDFLRSFRGLLVALNIFMPVDMVDIAEGKSASESPIPTGERKAKLSLVTIPRAPAGDTDLADGDDTKSAVDTAKGAATAGDAWGVIDTKTGEWLLVDPTDGAADEWHKEPGNAYRFTHARAKELAEEFDADDDGRMVARQLAD